MKEKTKGGIPMKSKVYFSKTITPEKVLELYHTLPTPRAKNDLLKEVLEKVVYVKEKSARWKGVAPDDFEITIFPKIPKSGQ